MRRTTFRLAIVAWLLGGTAWAQEYAQELIAPQPVASAQPTVQSTAPAAPPASNAPASDSLTPDYGTTPPHQKWQPMEVITPIPDVTTSNALPSDGAMPEGQILMPGTMVQPRPHGPCCEKTARGYCCPPNWYLDQRARVMSHPKPKETPIGGYGGIGQAYNGIQFVDVFGIDYAMTGRSMAFGPAAGYEITIGRYLGRDAENRDQFLEFTYYGLNQWDEDFAIHQTDRPTAQGAAFLNPSLYPIADNLGAFQTETFGNLYTIFDNRLAGFNRVDDLHERYESRFDNFELNVRIRPRMRHDRMVLYQNGCWRREAQDGCVYSFLVGARGMSLDEGYWLNGSGQVVVNNYDPEGVLIDSTTATTRGEYNVRTHNDMVGLQIGGDIVVRKGFLELGTRAKGAIFVNFADRLSSMVSTGGLDDPMGDVDLYDASGPYTNVNNQYSEYHTDRSRDAAGLLEVGFTASYQVRANLVVHAAYDMMWLMGVALAPEQVNGRIGSPGRVENGGVLFMQSLSLGLELDW